MIIDQKLLDDLSAQAKANPRLRQAYDLRTTPEDSSQRILNAVEPGTVLPVHRHRNSTETIVCLRGKVVQHYYDDNGSKVASYVLAPYTAQVAMSVPVGNGTPMNLSNVIPSFSRQRMVRMNHFQRMI